ncbi:MAG: GNAT family N-acetyltransferase [Actinomycetota bacterium]|nr:GNAT family N-acetyltransferase [Actinomycetota bacterium]
MSELAGSSAFQLLRVPWDDHRAIELRAAMDTEMGARYAGRSLDTAAASAAFAIDPSTIVAVVIVIDAGGTAVGHAALRRLGDEWEVKRVFVDSSRRGSGIGRLLMSEMESVARDDGAERLILHTGDQQPAAVAMYRGIGYTSIDVYPPYRDAIPFSVCFEKRLDPT